MTPTINLNGSSPRVMYEDLSDLRNHLSDARITLERVWPNKRDYLDHPKVYERDLREVKDWAEKIEALKEEILKSMEYLADYL